MLTLSSRRTLWTRVGNKKLSPSKKHFKSSHYQVISQLAKQYVATKTAVNTKINKKTKNYDREAAVANRTLDFRFSSITLQFSVFVFHW